MEIRFGIQSEDGKRRSSTWKVWSPKGSDDVFVVCRDAGGSLKASFHRAGYWHLAFDKAFVASKAPPDSPLHKDRFAHRWMHELDASTVTLALRVVSTLGGVSIPQDDPRESGVVWLPPPPEEKCMVVAVLFGPADWVPHASPVGHYDLPSGPRVWVRFAFGDWLPQKQWKVGAFHPIAQDAHTKLASTENLRVLIPGEDSLGKLFIEGRIESITPPPNKP